MDDEGLTKSAILLRLLGEEEAAQVFKFLTPREVQKLGIAMSKIRDVSRDSVERVLDDFQSDAESHSSLGTGSDEYLRSVLNRALGEEKAGYLLDRILQNGDAGGIESLKWMDGQTVSELIRKEHPQIIASILVHLERDQAAEIVTHFPDTLRTDVMLRVATLEGIQPSALQELNESLSKVLAGAGNFRKSASGGARVAAEILNFLGNAHESSVIDAVRDHDPDLAQKIVDEMFIFENLLELDDRAIQLVLREVQSESLIVALKGTSQELREKVFSNMSQRAAEMLRDDLEGKGPVKVTEVESEQKEILGIVRRLVEEGQVSLGAKGQDAYV